MQMDFQQAALPVAAIRLSNVLSEYIQLSFIWMSRGLLLQREINYRGETNKNKLKIEERNE